MKIFLFDEPNGVSQGLVLPDMIPPPATIIYNNRAYDRRSLLNYHVRAGEVLVLDEAIPNLAELLADAETSRPVPVPVFEHSDEPWQILVGGSEQHLPIQADGDIIAKVFVVPDANDNPDIEKCIGNAHRIVDCVNACKGLPRRLLQGRLLLEEITVLRHALRELRDDKTHSPYVEALVEVALQRLDMDF